MIWLRWTAVLGVLAALVGIVAPARGAAWFNDDGLFLVLSWNAANGFGLDLGVPQAPHYLFHAVLMKAGVRELWHFRVINYFVILASSMVFFLGLDRRGLRSPLVPVAVCASLLVSLNSIQSPNSLAMAFCLLGAGTYFFAIDATGRRKSVLLGTSGILFAVCGFMHAAVVIAALVLICIILVLDPSARRAPLWPMFVAVTACLWGIYIRELGLDNFLVAPGGHDARPGHLVRRLFDISTFYLEAALIYAATAAAFSRMGRRTFATAQAILSTIVTLYYGATFIADVLGRRPPPPILGWYFLSGEGQWISRVPGTVYYLLLFAAFRWIAEEVSDFARQKPVAFAEAAPRVRKWTIATAGLVLLHVATQTGSNTATIQGMVFFAGPALGLSMLLWHTLDRQHPPRWRVAVPVTTAWLALMTTFAFTYNHPTSDRVFIPGRTTLEEPPLRGVLETPRYAHSLAQFKDAYRANGCPTLPMAAFEYVPMANYILQRTERVGSRTIRPSMSFFEDRIEAGLDLESGWCVVDITGAETQINITRAGADKRAALRAWVAEHSDRVTQIPAPSEDLSVIRLYARDGRGTRQ